MSEELVNSAEFEPLSSENGDSDVLQGVMMEENSAGEPPESDVGVTAQQSACLTDIKPLLTPAAETDTSHTVEFEPLSSGSGVSEVPEDNKPLLQGVVMEENSAGEPPESDVEVTAQQSACLTDIKPLLMQTAETDTSYTKKMDVKKFFGWLLKCSVCDRKVEEVLMWQEPKLSAAVFVGGLAILLSLTMFSIISVIAHWALILLTVNFIFCLYKIIPAGFNKSPRAHPYSEFLEMDLKPSEESVDHWREMFVKYTTRFANDIRHIVLFEDIVDSLKCGLALWIMTYIGALFNGMTIAVLLYVVIFTAPKVYDSYKVQIIDGMNCARSQMKIVYGRLTSGLIQVTLLMLNQLFHSADC